MSDQRREAVTGRPAEFSITLRARADESPRAFAERLSQAIEVVGTVVGLLMIFGDNAAHSDTIAGLESSCGDIDFPVMWVQGASCHSGVLAGAQAILINTQAHPERVRIDGRVLGTLFRDADATHVLVGGVTPACVDKTSAHQGRAVFAAVQKALSAVGFTYGDLARTWFYNDDILAWYDDFNRERTSFYSDQRFASGSLPASTAVRGANPRGAALSFAGWAVRPVSAAACIREIASPLQCPAPAYGSSFSRAMEIVSGGYKRLLVSGTASIEPGGKTAWQGDTRKQIELTMAVIEAMLSSRGLSFRETTRATAYLKHAADIVLFDRWLEDHGLSTFPVVAVCCDICRDDLLFELELDACRAS